MSIPGLIYPTSKGMLAGNPRDSAIANMNNASAIQAQANNAVGGRRSRSRRNRSRAVSRVGGGTIAVPQYQMLYEPQGGPGTNPNNQIQANAAIATQGAANAALDSGAFKKGGRRSRSRKGGNSDWNWGCMSGGRKRRSHKRSTKRRASRKRRH
jgi:hypothetical protein